MAAFGWLALTFATLGQQLDGGFIQYDKALLEPGSLSEADWKKVVLRMHGLGMKTVIIQYLGQSAPVDGPLKPEPPNSETWCAPVDASEPKRFLYLEHNPNAKTDPTKVILDQAHGLGMDVYLGLIEPPVIRERGKPDVPTNAEPGFWKETNLAAFAEANSAFAKSVWKRYGGHPAFKGWYITHENWVGWYPGPGWGHAREYPDSWRAFYAQVTQACKAQSKRNGVPNDLNVAISPCLPGHPYDAARPGVPPKTNQVTLQDAVEIYAGMLADTGVNIVMLQDSVGAKPEVWNPTDAAAYLLPMRNICEHNGMQFWSNLECFATPGYIPCDPARFKKQIEVTANKHVIAKRVTFEYVHYLHDEKRLASGRPFPYYSSRMHKLRDVCLLPGRK